MTTEDVRVVDEPLGGSIANIKKDNYIEGIEGKIKSNGGKYKSEWVDENEESYRTRVKDPSAFIFGSFRTVTIDPKKKIKTVMGKLTGQDSMTIQTYIFPKAKWESKDQVVGWLNQSGHLPSQNSEVYSEGEVWEEIFDGEKIPESPFASEEKINEIVSNYNPSHNEVPIFLDHEEGKAYGWIDKVKAVGRKLYATFKELTNEAKSYIKNKEYKYKSVGLQEYPNRGAVLRELSLTNLPRVKGLNAIKHEEYSEKSGQEVNMMNPEEIKAMQESYAALQQKCADLEKQLATKDQAKTEQEQVMGEAQAQLSEQLSEMKKQMKELKFEKKIDSWITSGKIQPSMIEQYGGKDKMVNSFVENFSENQLDTMMNMFAPAASNGILDQVTNTTTSIETKVHETYSDKRINDLLQREGNQIKEVANTSLYNEIMETGKRHGKENFHESLAIYEKGL